MGADCIFCRIAEGSVNSQTVAEDDKALAFKDLNAAAPTHILVIPKKHIPSLAASGPEDEALLGHLQAFMRDLARDLKFESFRIVANNGRGAGQSVDHLHYHLLSGRRMTWPPG